MFAFEFVGRIRLDGRPRLCDLDVSVHLFERDARILLRRLRQLRGMGGIREVRVGGVVVVVRGEGQVEGVVGR